LPTNDRDHTELPGIVSDVVASASMNGSGLSRTSSGKDALDQLRLCSVAVVRPLFDRCCRKMYRDARARAVKVGDS